MINYTIVYNVCTTSELKVSIIALGECGIYLLMYNCIDYNSSPCGMQGWGRLQRHDYNYDYDYTMITKNDYDYDYSQKKLITITITITNP